MTEKIVVAEKVILRAFESEADAKEHIKSGETMLRPVKVDYKDIISIYPMEKPREAFEEFCELLDTAITTIDYSNIMDKWLTTENIFYIAEITVNDFGNLVRENVIIQGSNKYKKY